MVNCIFLLISAVGANLPVRYASENTAVYMTQQKKCGGILISFSTNVSYIFETLKSNVMNAALGSLCRIGQDRKADLHPCSKRLC